MSLDTLIAVQKAVALISIALLLVAAYSDIRTLKIPNVLVLAIAALGIVRLVLLGNPIVAIYAIAAVILVFIIGFLLFSFRLLGAGDVKLLMATVLLIRYRDLYGFFVLMAVFGALLSIAVIVARNWMPLFLGPRLAAYMATIRPVVPYGVAISAAAVVTLLLQPLLFRYSSPLDLSFLW